MRRLLGKCVAVIVSFVIFATSAACFDLGAFEDENGGYNQYYDTFGDVECLFDGGKHEYEIEKSLFNDYTFSNLDWEDDDDAVAKEAYVYIVVPIERAVNIESVALFVLADDNDEITVSAFYYENESQAPEKIKYKSSPDTETIVVQDENGNDVEQEVEIEYDDPDVQLCAARATFSASNDGWSSFILANWRQEGYDDGILHGGDDGLLYIRFENNSGLYKQTKTCTFTFINLLVRAV